MSSISALQRRLDSQFDKAQTQLDDATLDASEGYSQEDSLPSLKPVWDFPTPAGLRARS